MSSTEILLRRRIRILLASLTVLLLVYLTSITLLFVKSAEVKYGLNDLNRTSVEQTRILAEIHVSDYRITQLQASMADNIEFMRGVNQEASEVPGLSISVMALCIMLTVIVWLRTRKVAH